MRKETEEALNKSAKVINELNESLEAKDEELVNLEAKNEELELTVSELSDKAKELEGNLENMKSDFEAKETELTEQLETAREELDNIKKDQMAKARFEELTNEGVAAAGEEAIKDQVAKIREMEDEEFESYKADRVDLRKSVLASLEASEENTEDETNEAEAAAEENTEEEESASEENASEEEGSEEASEEDAEAQLEDEEEAAANSEDSIDPMKAVAALLNVETIPTDDIRSYHINSDKIREFLSFEPKYSIQNGIKSICKAHESRLIKDGLNNPLYHNIKLMQKVNLK